jgi:Cdc6-like AAA superfamily ATPase
MPRTRKWLIDKIDDWLGDHQVSNLLLLTGSPGAGKSAIALTLVSNLQEAGRLGSSFFYKRGDMARGDPAACWRTIAFDLAQCDCVITKTVVEDIRGRKPKWI